MSVQAKLFQVVTFATDPLRGNPAFVLSGAGDASDQALAAACDILHADVLAVVGETAGDGTPIRFYTAEGPHPGAGHATLAAAHTVLRDGIAGNGGSSVTFLLANGDRRAARLE